jgi:hypothetical protein
MGFFDEIGDFFQDNILDPVKKVTRQISSAVPDVLRPALLAVPGVGPALAGASQLGDIFPSTGPRATAPPRMVPQSPIATPGIVPWQTGGQAPTLPPSVPGAFQASAYGQSPRFFPQQVGGFAPGTGGYSPFSGNVYGAQLNPRTPYVDKRSNPYLPPSGSRQPIPVYIVPGPGGY